MEYNISEIIDSSLKSQYTKMILERLPKWFGIQASIDQYVVDVAAFPYFAAFNQENQCIGFFSLKVNPYQVGELVVCGILPEYHHCGIGKALISVSEAYFKESGCKYMLVQTLSDTVDNEAYAQTRRFYERVGFVPLITFTEIWDEQNPCLVMLKNR